MFNTSPQSFTSPPATPQTVPGDPKAAMPGFNPVQQQGFSFPQTQRSPYPASPPPGGAPFGGSPPSQAPQFASSPPQPLQGGFFGGMNQRPPMGQPMGAPPTPGFNPQSPGMMPAPARAAQSMRGFGRGNDTMLMHVTPGEVQGLQALAQQHGGSLTTNPHTGLPEAGFLEDILPMLAGGLLTMTGIGAPLAALMVGGGTGLATGDLGKGLMAGLGAFGGGSLAGALGAGAAGAGGALAQGAGGNVLTNAATAAVPELAIAPSAATAAQLAGTGAASALPGAVIAPTAAQAATLAGQGAVGGSGLTLAPSAAQAATLAGQGGSGMFNTIAADAGKNAVAQGAAAAAQPGMLQSVLGQNMGDQVAGFGQRFAQAASGGAKISPTRTGLAALGASAPVLNAMQPTYEPYKKEDDWNYEGPYTPTQRTARFRGPNPTGDSSEFSYFDNTNPYPGYEPAPRAFADGGEVAQTEDRALRMPTAGYQAGMGPEHNYNFRPVNPAPGMGTGAAPTPTQSGGQSFADMIASAASKSKNSGLAEDNARHAQGMRRFRYDPRTQSVVDDGSYNEMGGPGGGMGSLGGLGGMGGLGSQQFAGGGDVNLRDGSFVVDARTVSELGNGSSGAGQELLARHGGQPIRGPGDGVSDSVPANIGGRQRAKVARDEVKFDPEAVQRIGGGSAQRGAQKLYALMEKAQKARKAAGRGQDTKLRKALSK